MSPLARHRRAAVAARLLAGAPALAPALDWDTLDAAPAWLALDDEAFAAFQCRVGALLFGSTLRLWIDRGRLAAARSAVGPAFLEALLAERGVTLLPPGLVNGPVIEAPAQVRPALRLAGASVLLSTLSAGALRAAVSMLLAPAVASAMAAPLAASLVAHAGALGRGIDEGTP